MQNVLWRVIKLIQRHTELLAFSNNEFETSFHTDWIITSISQEENLLSLKTEVDNSNYHQQNSNLGPLDNLKNVSFS